MFDDQSQGAASAGAAADGEDPAAAAGRTPAGVTGSDHDGTCAAPFWETVPLAAMTPAQWESLCDGCGKCCVEKFEDEDTGRIHYTDVACVLLDRDTCRCADYPNRARRVPDCVTLTIEKLANPRWLPGTCAYRRLAEGRGLPRWHPLRTGDAASVLRAGEHMGGRLRDPASVEDPLLHLIDWIR